METEKKSYLPGITQLALWREALNTQTWGESPSFQWPSQKRSFAIFLPILWWKCPQDWTKLSLNSEYVFQKKKKKIWAIASGRSVLYSCKRQSGRKAWYVKLLHFLSNLDDLWENKRKQNTWTCYDKKDKHFRLRGCPSVTQTTCHRGRGALSCAGVHWNAITPPWGHSNKGVLTDYCHSVKV